MSYKVHISEINVLGYLQRVSMLKVLIITILEMIMLSLLPEVPTAIVASNELLENVVQKIEHLHEKRYENVYVWSDGMMSQFRSRYIFKLLASKGLMNGIGGTIKNVILR